MRTMRNGTGTASRLSHSQQRVSFHIFQEYCIISSARLRSVEYCCMPLLKIWLAGQCYGRQRAQSCRRGRPAGGGNARPYARESIRPMGAAPARTHTHIRAAQARGTGPRPPGRVLDARHAAGRSIFQGGSCPPQRPPAGSRTGEARSHAGAGRVGAVRAGRWRHGARAFIRCLHRRSPRSTVKCTRAARLARSYRGFNSA